MFAAFFTGIPEHAPVKLEHVHAACLLMEPVDVLSDDRGEHLVLINRSATPYDDAADLVIHDTIGKVLDAIVSD